MWSRPRPTLQPLALPQLRDFEFKIHSTILDPGLPRLSPLDIFDCISMPNLRNLYIFVASFDDILDETVFLLSRKLPLSPQLSWAMIQSAESFVGDELVGTFRELTPLREIPGSSTREIEWSTAADSRTQD